MTRIVLEVTIVLSENISAEYLVWHIGQKGKRSLVVQTYLSRSKVYLCNNTHKQDLSVKTFYVF